MAWLRYLLIMYLVFFSGYIIFAEPVFAEPMLAVHVFEEAVSNKNVSSDPIPNKPVSDESGLTTSGPSKAGLVKSGHNNPRFNDIVKIEAGNFNMGCSFDDDNCDPDEDRKGGTVVFVDTFYIQQHEVSVAEYRTCVKTSDCIVPYTYQRNKYCNYDAPGRDEHPINCISWPRAQNYCSVLGGRLPLEAEWEKAARAGSNTRYPWGHETASCQHAIMDDEQTAGSVENEFDGCGEDRTWPRGSRKPNQFGLYDMTGGTAEWVYNWFSETAIKDFYGHNLLSGPESGRWKVIRGGAWDEQAWAQTSSNRWAKKPTGHSSIYGSNGFRCAFKSKNASQTTLPSPAPKTITEMTDSVTNRLIT